MRAFADVATIGIRSPVSLKVLALIESRVAGAFLGPTPLNP